MNKTDIWDLMAKVLSGNSTGEEKDQLDLLLEKDLELKQTFFYLKRLNVKVETAVVSEEEVTHSFNKIFSDRLTNSTAVKKSKRKTRRWWAAAASVLILLGMGSFYFFFSGHETNENSGIVFQEKEETFVASQLTSVVLEDGTKVWLNRGSVLQCEEGFSKGNRKVRLNGEAFFDVAQDKDYPFVVALKDGISVKVLGTRFNVKAYENTSIVEASLLSGKIALNINESGEGRIIMKPLEKVKINLDHLKKERKDVIQKTVKIVPIKESPVDHKIPETAWMENRLSFYNMSFRELGFELERIYGKKIVFKDKKLESYHLTGSFEGENLARILKALQITTPFHFKIKDSVVQLYSTP